MRPGAPFDVSLDIAPGNSGSPVFNANHEVVGVIEAEGNHATCPGSFQGSPCARWRGCDGGCGAPVVVYPVIHK